MIDVTKVLVIGGSGGNGSFSYLRSKYVPKGGPDGGDGGDGGSVYLLASASKRTLDDLAPVWEIKAESGQNGGSQQMFGKAGQDREIEVPPGTVVWELDPDTGERISKLGELFAAGDRLLVARGGIGGRGNVHFKSSRNTTPLEYEIGGQGEERVLELELKLLADVGFVGFPNAGKSTLLSVLTKARPRIADYPFTTLEPHLGVMELLRVDGSAQRYILADIPGLIEEASAGKGLGHQFLRHIERCQVLIYLLYLEEQFLLPELDHESRVQMILQQFSTLQEELREHNPELLARPFLVVLNKLDILPEGFWQELQIVWQTQFPTNSLLGISAATQQGIEELKQEIDSIMQKLPPRTEGEKKEQQLPVFSLPQADDSRKPVLAYRTPLKKVG